MLHASAGAAAAVAGPRSPFWRCLARRSSLSSGGTAVAPPLARGTSSSTGPFGPADGDCAVISRGDDYLVARLRADIDAGRIWEGLPGWRSAPLETRR